MRRLTLLACVVPALLMGMIQRPMPKTTGTPVSFVSVYPPAQSDTYVKATTKYSTSYWPYFTTDPTITLIGSEGTHQWDSVNGTVTNQRFHIDLGAGQTIIRIYYENSHSTGSTTNAGVQNFTFWGSNSATAFADLVYADDTDWTQLTTSPTAFVQHVSSNVPDPRYITVTNTTAYQYYAFKFADNWGNAAYMGIRRIELQRNGP